jgi:glycosyltransferase involved in cell wall biosynthesis
MSTRSARKSLSVIVPAFNEEGWLPLVLESIERSAEGVGPVEIMVVDNASTDGTADAASAAGARIVWEPTKNLAAVRNAGARAATGSVLMWVDADTPLPPEALSAVSRAMSDPSCIGGAFDAVHEAARPLVRGYLRMWRAIGRVTRMAQGAAQFARRDAFEAVDGYDERLFMGEDVDFWWRLRRHARRSGGRVELIDDPPVLPSPRRFDRWPLWRTLVFTNPLLIPWLQRSRRAWKGWYVNPPR